VPLAVPGGVRALDYRRDARRRDAVHARRRGGGAVAHLPADPQLLGAHPPAHPRAAGGWDTSIRSGVAGAGGGDRDPAPRPRVARDLSRGNDILSCSPSDLLALTSSASLPLAPTSDPFSHRRSDLPCSTV